MTDMLIMRVDLEGVEGLPDRVLMYAKRDPVSVLMEYGQTREVKVGFSDISRSGPHHASRFHTSAVVDGETFPPGTGTSKKNAKKVAAIVALRTIYLLKQLSGYKSRESHALFTRNQETGLVKLHDDIRVHLYISRPPCGDAAAFPTITNFPNRMRAIRKQGQLRTIIDDGEGAIPTDFPLPANANGKERLRVMTCSDKILRWNALGVQGGLVSNFMDPIYMSSVVIGSHTGDQRGHVPRAVSGRLKCGRLHEVLQKPYRICSPNIVYPPSSDVYAITKSKQYCITWSQGDPDAEVIDAVTGSTAMEPADDSPSSRVSKKALFGAFHEACDNLAARHLLTLTYSEAKRSARAYQRTKVAVEHHLQTCGFGQWLSLQETYGTDDFHDDEKR
nr:hypothetical protein BaRGS_012757 [Batillaria attramentaria]